MKLKTVLSIAGSDSSGGAGIQADIKTMTMNGVYAMTAITALTAQNTTGVRAIQEVTPEFLSQQIDAVFEDIFPDAVKIGMIPSSSLGATSCGLYEPIHGSAPDIAGMDIANPIGTILSSAMMLRYSFDMSKEADAIENAVSAVLDEGFRTADIMSDGCKKVGCSEMGKLIISKLERK